MPPDRRALDLDRRCARSDAREGSETVNRRHEIELETIVFADHAVQVRCRVVRSKDRGPERSGEILELTKVVRCLPKQEVEVDRGHRRALERRCGVPNEDDIEMESLQLPRDFTQQRPGIHAVSIVLAKQAGTSTRRDPSLRIRRARGAAPAERTRPKKCSCVRDAVG